MFFGEVPTAAAPVTAAPAVDRETVLAEGAEARDARVRSSYDSVATAYQDKVSVEVDDEKAEAIKISLIENNYKKTRDFINMLTGSVTRMRASPFIWPPVSLCAACIFFRTPITSPRSELFERRKWRQKAHRAS